MNILIIGGLIVMKQFMAIALSIKNLDQKIIYAIILSLKKVRKMDLRRINNERFSIRFVFVCKELGIKTIHTAKKKLTSDLIGTKTGRFLITNNIINEINDFK